MKTADKIDYCIIKWYYDIKPAGLNMAINANHAKDVKPTQLNGDRKDKNILVRS